MSKEVLLLEDLTQPASGSILEKIADLITYQCHRRDFREVGEELAAEKTRYAATIFNCDFFGEAELAFAVRLAAWSGETPILVATRQISVASYREIDRLRNTVAIQRDFQPEIFRGLFERITLGGEIKPTICPRFLTDEEVRILHLDTGITLTTRMRNYSAGGLFVEYRGIALGVGDRIQVTLPDRHSGIPSAHLHLKARVVWERKGDDQRSPARGLGLQFI